MNSEPAIQLGDLHRSFGRTDAVNGLDLAVAKGRCCGLFGRNGAGKTTAIKCLLNLLRPKSGRVSVFGMDPRTNEVAVKSRLTYVPDNVGFHSWMRVRDVLESAASFRRQWNRDIDQKAAALSKGQKMQLALISAVCPEPDLLVLGEPTTGLDPIARRESMESVIGASQDAAPGERTILVSTHLITEFEGLIDEFTILEAGRNILTMEAAAARERFVKARARFDKEPPDFQRSGIQQQRRRAREIELILTGQRDEILAELRNLNPVEVSEESLSLEEIFLAARHLEGAQS